MRWLLGEFQGLGFIILNPADLTGVSRKTEISKYSNSKYKKRINAWAPHALPLSQ